MFPASVSYWVLDCAACSSDDLSTYILSCIVACLAGVCVCVYCTACSAGSAAALADGAADGSAKKTIYNGFTLYLAKCLKDKARTGSLMIPFRCCLKPDIDVD